VALLHQAADALNRVLAAYISGREDISKIPAHKRRCEDSAAAGKFEVFNRAKVNELFWYFVEKGQQRVNFGAVNMRDGAPIEIVPVRAEKAIDRLNNLARKDLRHCGSLANEVLEGLDDIQVRPL
jgi:hypothetical protein